MKKIITVALLAMITIACGGKKNEQANASKKDLPKIGVTIYKYDDNFMSFTRRAIKTAAGDKVELLMNDSQNSQATQNDQVDIMISKGVKALAINLVDPQAAATIIEKAKKADIPVVFFNKEPSEADINSYDKAWYVGALAEESGIIQGKLIAENWKKNPNWDKNKDGILQYVLLKGEPGHPDAEKRTKYSVDTIKENGVKVEQLELQTGMWDSVKGKDLMDAWLAKNGDKIEVVIANNDAMALGAIQSLKAAGYFTEEKSMPVFGVDAIPDALQQIKDGVMTATVLNDAKNQGTAVFELTYNLVQGKEPLEGTAWTFDDKKAVLVPYVGISLENIEFGEEAYK